MNHLHADFIVIIAMLSHWNLGVPVISQSGNQFMSLCNKYKMKGDVGMAS